MPFNGVANQTQSTHFLPPCIAGCTEVPYYGRPGHSVGFVTPHTADSSQRLVGR